MKNPSRRKIRALNTHRGQPNRVPPTRVQQRLTHLRTTMSWQQIADATGCSSAHLREILRGDWPTINLITEEKVLAARPAAAPAPGMYIDATPSVRRVRALMAAGHPQHAIAAAAGTPTNRVRLLANGQTGMRQMLADKIETAWQQLRDTTGSSTRARNMAASCGWQDPTWWEDFGHIDNPSFDPATAESGEAPRYVTLAEDWAELERQGYDRQQAADRLGVTRDNLTAAIARSRRQYRRAA